ncbi:SRPBCC domain-containing protein [Agaribacterium sp. ZY112]|uniref:SRPBCC family protein n=1 Tax=Agaribacterium sp. ZY112 TaxID=3233574 RepID=UPI00352313B4
MHSILHKIVIEASTDELFQAISSEKGLSKWWSKTNINAEQVSIFFGPNDEHQVQMQVLSSIPGQEIIWQCISGPWADKGEFIFSITEHERGSCLDFAHHGWQEADDFYKHCNAKWGFFFTVSLKQYLETGKGQAHPNDPSI